jgi:hypothetical protein
MPSFLQIDLTPFGSMRLGTTAFFHRLKEFAAPLLPSMAQWAVITIDGFRHTRRNEHTS